MKIEDTGRAIIELLGLQGDAGNALLEALDTRYKRAPPKVITSQMLIEKVGDVVMWHGKSHRVGKCPDPATQCFTCDRVGKHLEPIVEPTVIIEADLGRQAEDENFTDEVAGRLAELGLEVSRR